MRTPSPNRRATRGSASVACLLLATLLLGACGTDGSVSDGGPTESDEAGSAESGTYVLDERARCGEKFDKVRTCPGGVMTIYGNFDTDVAKGSVFENDEWRVEFRGVERQDDPNPPADPRSERPARVLAFFDVTLSEDAPRSALLDDLEASGAGKGSSGDAFPIYACELTIVPRAGRIEPGETVTVRLCLQGLSVNVDLVQVALKLPCECSAWFDASDSLDDDEFQAAIDDALATLDSLGETDGVSSLEGEREGFAAERSTPYGGLSENGFG